MDLDKILSQLSILPNDRRKRTSAYHIPSLVKAQEEIKLEEHDASSLSKSEENISEDQKGIKVKAVLPSWMQEKNDREALEL